MAFWRERSADAAAVEGLVGLGLSPLQARLLAVRGGSAANREDDAQIRDGAAASLAVEAVHHGGDEVADGEESAAGEPGEDEKPRMAEAFGIAAECAAEWAENGTDAAMRLASEKGK